MTNARLEELRTKYQENPRRYFAPYANELRKAGDPAQAITVCRAHLSGQPGHVSGHIVLGQALYEAGEATEARDIFTAALDLDPENLIALRTLGEIAQVNGEFSEARQWYERLLDADPRNTEVAQFLKDLPDGAVAAPEASAVTEEKPATRREEEPQPAYAPPPPPAPSFHTSFTGSNQAYEPEREEPVAASEPPELVELESETAEFAPPAPPAQPEPVEAHAPDEALEMIDLDSFASAEANAEPEIVASMPDESPAAPSDDVERLYDYQPTSLEAVEEHVESSIEAAPAHDEVSSPYYEEEATTAYAEMEAEVAPPAAEAPLEPPRASFAQHGFDGPAGDEIGWMTTPSAAHSDLESAPESWFDEPAAIPEAEQVNAQAEEPAQAQASDPDHSTDSWFDDVEGAAVIEATETTSDEFWLPPDLPRVTAHDEPATEQAPEFVEASMMPYDAPMEAEAPVAEASMPVEEQPVAAQPVVEAYIAPEPVAEAPIEEPAHVEHFEVQVAAEDADEAVLVEHPAEMAPVSSWTDAQESSAPAEAEPVMTSWSEPEPAAPSEEVIAASAPDESVAEEMAPAQPVAEIVDYATSLPLIEAAPPAMSYAEETTAQSPAQPAAPFVTETLAELYMQQGFRDEALSIYRQLLERNPDDATLQRRIEAIEQGETPAVAAEPAPIENRASSQSVRTFFSRLAKRTATPVVHQEQANTPEVPFANAASALANLFAASKPPATDEGAASSLATAFTDPAGRPSRAADRELSLDHLFRDVQPGQASGGVNMDEFFAPPNAQPGSPTESEGASESPESGGTDIRQFTAWLEGLRKK